MLFRSLLEAADSCVLVDVDELNTENLAEVFPVLSSDIVRECTVVSLSLIHILRSANDHFNLANFMRANLYASVAVLKIGNDVLFKDEKVQVCCLLYTSTAAS